MAKVKCLSRRTTASVQIKQLALLVSIKYKIELPMTEEDSTSDKSMRFLSGQPLNFCLQILIHREAAESNEQLFIINALVSGCLYLKGRDKILLLLLFLSIFYMCTLH